MHCGLAWLGKHFNSKMEELADEMVLNANCNNKLLYMKA